MSPSLQYLRDSHQSNNSPMSRGNTSRLPIAIPVMIPSSNASSTTSSPTISNAYPPFPRGINITSSPTLRATMTMPSPILRPLGRRRDEDEREIEGAGEAVNSLTIGYVTCQFFNVTADFRIIIIALVIISNHLKFCQRNLNLDDLVCLHNNLKAIMYYYLFSMRKNV